MLCQKSNRNGCAVWSNSTIIWHEIFGVYNCYPHFLWLLHFFTCFLRLFSYVHWVMNDEHRASNKREILWKNSVTSTWNASARDMEITPYAHVIFVAKEVSIGTWMWKINFQVTLKPTCWFIRLKVNIKKKHGLSFVQHLWDPPVEFHFYESSRMLLIQDLIYTLYHKQCMYYQKNDVAMKD